MKRFQIKKLRDVNTPSRSYDHAAGWDFYVPNNFKLLPGVNPHGMIEDVEWEHKVIKPGCSLFVPSGIQLRMHKGWALRFDNKSGIAKKGAIAGATIVDQDYQGEIHLNIWNVSNEDFVVKRGQKILQGIFFQTYDIELDEIELTEQLHAEPTKRGGNGFGSTDSIHRPKEDHKKRS